MLGDLCNRAEVASSMRCPNQPQFAPGVTIEFSCRVDGALAGALTSALALLHPSEVVTIGLLQPLSCQGHHTFTRWFQEALRALFPRLPKQPRLLRLTNPLTGIKTLMGRKTKTVFTQADVSSGAGKVKALIDAGADVDTRFEEGLTPLMIASVHGDVGTVEVLLQAGADLELQQEEREMTALMKAALSIVEKSGEGAMNARTLPVIP